jgi:hypothetical protein
VNATVWVAVAGILGTLLAPLLAERVRRNSTRAEQLRAERLRVYADLLRVTAVLADNASTWSAIPLADLKETDDEELDRVFSEARVVASKPVYERLRELSRLATEFNRQLFWAKVQHQKVRDKDQVDDAESIVQRMSLGDVAGKMVRAHKQIEAAIRKEMT